MNSARNAKAIQQRSLEHIQKMRSELDQAERHVKKGQLYGAYSAFKALRSRSFSAADFLSDKTLKAAMDWGSAVSIRDSNGKHTGYAIMGDL